MRRVKGGPWVPVLIWCEQITDDEGELAADERIRADVFGDAEDPSKIWTHLRPITKQEYDDLTAYRLANQHLLDDFKPVSTDLKPTRPNTGQRA